MNQNRNWKNRIWKQTAAGLSVLLASMPVCAATSTDNKDTEISKEETVYVLTDGREMPRPSQFPTG